MLGIRFEPSGRCLLEWGNSQKVDTVALKELQQQPTGRRGVTCILESAAGLARREALRNKESPLQKAGLEHLPNLEDFKAEHAVPDGRLCPP